MLPTKIAVFGVTGSIGVSTVDVLEAAFAAASRRPSVEVVTGGSNVTALAKSARRLRAKRAVAADASKYHELTALLAGSEIEVSAGADAVDDAATIAVDWAMMAISGLSALRPIVRLLAQGCTLAIANKEALVGVGGALMAQARRGASVILPVDSEHNAIFQLLENCSSPVSGVWLTASGGALRDWSLPRLPSATLQDAMAHPTWNMGRKITIDSATMMNKALEHIEAMHLFALSPQQVRIFVHRQSIAHGFIVLSDGTLMGSFSPPDMRYAIRHTLYWPQRVGAQSPASDVSTNDTLTSGACLLGEMSFEQPDAQRYPALRLGMTAARAGGSMPCVLNAANEAAVEAFIAGRIGYQAIAETCAQALQWFASGQPDWVSERVEEGDVTRVLEFHDEVKDRVNASLG